MTRGDLAMATLALAAGAMLPLQALINGRLGGAVASPLWATLLQTLVGATVVAAVLGLSRTPVPAAGQLAATPVWAWAGGVLGMIFVFGALIATRNLGATRAMTAVIVGQLISSVLLDQFGVIGPRRTATLETVAGVMLLALGAVLILRRG